MFEVADETEEKFVLRKFVTIFKYLKHAQRLRILCGIAPESYKARSWATIVIFGLTAATLCDCNEVTLCIFDAAAGPNCCNACNAPKTTSKSGLFNKLEMASMCGSAAGEPMRPSA
eukprot:3811965-Amphidinium_carterae.1